MDEVLLGKKTAFDARQRAGVLRRIWATLSDLSRRKFVKIFVTDRRKAQGMVTSVLKLHEQHRSFSERSKEATQCEAKAMQASTVVSLTHFINFEPLCAIQLIRLRLQSTR